MCLVNYSQNIVSYKVSMKKDKSQITVLMFYICSCKKTKAYCFWFTCLHLESYSIDQIGLIDLGFFFFCPQTPVPTTNSSQGNHSAAITKICDADAPEGKTDIFYHPQSDRRWWIMLHHSI